VLPDLGLPTKELLDLAGLNPMARQMGDVAAVAFEREVVSGDSLMVHLLSIRLSGKDLGCGNRWGRS
jgi:hypothetical protein